MIALGSTNASKVYLGSEEISKIYLGSTQIWGGSSPTPPTPVLPYDAEIEYLEGDGNQYIDTGFIPDDTCGMYIEVCSNGYNGSSQHIFGCIGDSTDSRWNINYAIYNQSNRIVVNWNGANNTDLYNTPYTFDEIKNNYLNSRKAYVNDIQVRASSATLKSINRSAYLFASHISSGYANPLPGRIGFLKISKGYDIIMDFIPVRVGQVGYMYDRVSKQLFGNAGTGSFILGNDVTT